MKDGEIIELNVQRSLVIAYLTSRGEEEIIIDPSLIERVPKGEQT
jgi:hypothetical protein